MEYNDIIKQTLSHLFTSHEFSVIDDERNLIIFHSKIITVRFVYNPYEFQCYYFLRFNFKEMEYENYIVEDHLKIVEEQIFSEANQETKIRNWALRKLEYLEKLIARIAENTEDSFSELDRHFKSLVNDYNKKLNH